MNEIGSRWIERATIESAHSAVLQLFSAPCHCCSAPILQCCSSQWRGEKLVLVAVLRYGRVNWGRRPTAGRTVQHKDSTLLRERFATGRVQGSLATTCWLHDQWIEVG